MLMGPWVGSFPTEVIGLDDCEVPATPMDAGAMACRRRRWAETMRS
jgi:hypothetical protein